MNEIFSKIHRFPIMRIKITKTLRTIYYTSLFVFVLVGFVGCKKIPKYSKTPEIAFESITVNRNVFDKNYSTYGDNLIIKIRYQDGDGDLGLANSDTGSYSYNYIIDSKIKQNGIYVPLEFPDNFNLNGKFPQLSPPNTVGPIDGELNYTVFVPYNFFVQSNDTLGFTIQIIDRAGNYSNQIVTTPVVVKKI